MTQQEQVLSHLKRYGSITSWDAIMNYHATRLSGIIFKLRKQGYHIASDIESNGGRNYARYTLEAESNENKEAAVGNG